MKCFCHYAAGEFGDASTIDLDEFCAFCGEVGLLDDGTVPKSELNLIFMIANQDGEEEVDVALDNEISGTEELGLMGQLDAMDNPDREMVI